MIRYRYENTIGMISSFAFKQTEVSESNAGWFITQILRDVQTSKNGADSIIALHRADWCKPESLKDYELDHKPTVTECILYKLALSEFINLILERMKEYDVTKRSVSSAQVAFVNSIYDTRIKVVGDTVKIHTMNYELEERIKKAIDKEGYKVSSIKKLEDMGFYNY